MLKIIEDDCINILKKVDISIVKNKNILITGASGIVGVYILKCLKLIDNVDRVKITCWINSDIDPVFNGLYENCTIIKKDITDEKALEELKNMPNYDYIFHCAGYAQPNKFLENKVKTIQLNTYSTIKLFENLTNNGTFVFMSTSEIYSGLDYENINEDQIGTSNTSHPRSCYIEGKRCGESICQAYKEMGYNVKVIRLSLAYGPGTKKNDQRVLNSLFQKAFEKQEIRLLDSGSSIRTYGYISDIIEMIWNISISGKHSIYNVAGNSVITIKDLANKIGKITNCPVNFPIDNSYGLAGNPSVVNLSLNRYMLEFSKDNFISLDEGLQKTYLWQKALYGK
jgi:UDP-glucuronate decarboxylase